jgi:hypothetical protein
MRYRGLLGFMSKEIEALDRRGSEKVGSVQSSRDCGDLVQPARTPSPLKRVGTGRRIS